MQLIPSEGWKNRTLIVTRSESCFCIVFWYNELSASPEAEIAAACPFSEHSRPLKYQTEQIAVDSFIVLTENLRELRAAQFRKGTAIRTGGNPSGIRPSSLNRTHSGNRCPARTTSLSSGPRPSQTSSASPAVSSAFEIFFNLRTALSGSILDDLIRFLRSYIMLQNQINRCRGWILPSIWM